MSGFRVEVSGTQLRCWVPVEFTTVWITDQPAWWSMCHGDQSKPRQVSYASWARACDALTQWRETYDPDQIYRGRVVPV